MYAGFLKRVAAYLIDTIISYLLLLAVMLILAFVLHHRPTLLIQTATSLFIFFFYFVYLESSPWQATLGKKMVGIKVTDLNGGRISFTRSLVRHLGMMLSSLILGIGYLMCIWTEKKQCLHDMLAGCLVVDKNYSAGPDAPIIPSPIKWWMILLVLIPAFLFVGGIMAALLMPVLMKQTARVRTAEAEVLLYAARHTQQIRAEQGLPYAASWKELDASAKANVPSATFCTNEATSEETVNEYKGCGNEAGWAVTLGPSAVTAWRVNDIPYRLELPYASSRKAICVPAQLDVKGSGPEYLREAAVVQKAATFCSGFNKRQNRDK